MIGGRRIGQRGDKGRKKRKKICLRGAEGVELWGV